MKSFPKQSYFHLRSKNVFSRKVVKSVIKEVLTTAESTLNKKTKDMKILDVGCGAGEHSLGFSKHVSKAVGIEPFEDAYKAALKNKKRYRSKAVFINKLVEDYTVKEKFDLVVSLTTIEHMPNAKKSFESIFKLLKDGGIIYLTAPNKWWPFEYHYRLPFLSWLPIPLANWYVRITNRGDSYMDSAYSRSYFGMRKLFDRFPCKYEFVLPADLNCAYVGCGNDSFFYNLIKGLGFRLIKLLPIFWIFSKGFIMVIQKNEKSV